MTNCCITTINATAATISGTTLQISTDPVTLSDGQRYKLVIPDNIVFPDGIEQLALTVINGADAIPLWTCGNARSILGNQLSCFSSPCYAIKYVIPMQYVNTGIATNPAHFTVIRRV